MLKQNAMTMLHFAGQVVPNLKHSGEAFEGSLKVKELIEQGIELTLVQVYDNYTRDHILGDNSQVGFAFIYFAEDVYCFPAYESNPNGARSIEETETLVLDGLHLIDFDDQLFEIIYGEYGLEVIWGVENKNDKAAIEEMFRIKYPHKTAS